MSERSNVVYIYDGSYYGLLTCAFESVYCKESPMNIITEETEQMTLIKPKHITTDKIKAIRVEKSIPLKISKEAENLIKQCFLTCAENKEMIILDFLKKGYKYGKNITQMLTDDTVKALTDAVKHLNNESHLYKGFVRFKVYDNIMVSEIKPKNFVLPMIKSHFCDRYPNESFIIYDSVHSAALMYKPHLARIFAVDGMDLRTPDNDELKFQQLWQNYYKSISIEGRYNPKCRISHMPKRYWDCMTEMDVNL